MLAERPLTTRTAIEVCTTIKSIDMDVRAVPCVALRNDATGEIIYTPPAGADQLRDLLSNWGRFIHEAEDATMKAHAPQIYSRELVDVIFAQPYCRTTAVRRTTSRSPSNPSPTAARPPARCCAWSR